MWIYIAVAVMVCAGIAFGAPAFYFICLLVGGASVIQAKGRKAKKAGTSNSIEHQPVSQPQDELGSARVTVAGAAQDSAKTNGVPMPTSAPASEANTPEDTEEPFRQFKGGVSASQQPQPAKETSTGTWAAIVLISALVFIVLHFELYPKEKPAPKPSEEAYTSAKLLDYRKAMLVQTEAGAMLAFYGQISQIVGDHGAMIATDKGFIGYSGNQVYLEFESKPQVLDGDVVRIFGRYAGTWKYKNIFGADTEVPYVIVDYYKVTEPKH